MDGLQDLLTGRGHDITTLSVGTSDRCLSCRSASFLAMERQYMMGPWTPGKIAMTALVPAWFVACAWACWRRSWVGGFVLITAGTLLKVAWSFYFGGESGWTIVPPAAVGFVVCTVISWYAHRRVHRLEDIHA